MQQIKHVINDPLGMHARPAGLLVKTAAPFSSRITVSTPAGAADARRLMALMCLAAKKDTEMTITIEGTDEVQAASALRAFLDANL